MAIPNWRERARCRGVDPELFFPTAEPGSHHNARQVAAAKAVCAGCPVRAECLAAGAEFGIWGGRTAGERRVIRRWERDVRRRRSA